MTRPRAFPGRVFFDHLPKTAGTAVSSWLVEELGNGCINDRHLWGNHRDLIRQYGGIHSIISAHTSFSDAEGLDPRYQYMTFFREPVDRVVSWLYFTRNDSDLSRPDAMRSISLVSTFLDSEGNEVPDELLGDISNLYVEHFCRIYGTGRENDEEKVANAMAAIKRYEVVGICEQMPRLLADVAGLIGLWAPESIPRIHVTSKRPQISRISPALRERIVALNRLDLLLYDQVRAWKESTRCDEASVFSQPVVHGWEKYDRVLDRLIVTPDLILGTAGVREGYIIQQRRPMTLDVAFLLTREVHEIQIGIHIYDLERHLMFGINNSMLGQQHKTITAGSYRAIFHLFADLPLGSYSAGFAVAELLAGRQKELAWYDSLMNFEVHYDTDRPFAGCVYLPTEFSLCASKAEQAPRPVVTNALGALYVETSLLSMPRGACEKIEVRIVNQSEQVWAGDIFHPINISYHWLKKSGETLVFNGLRTPLPETLRPDQSLCVRVQVKAPEYLGEYHLVLTMVQENVAWFENMGFQPARIGVEVFAA